jgi:hypothetical protein
MTWATWDDFTYKIFIIIIFPIIAFKFEKETIYYASICDIWMLMMFCYQAIFVKPTDRPMDSRRDKVWRYWKQLRDYSIITVLVTLWSCLMNPVFGFPQWQYDSEKHLPEFAYVLKASGVT